MITSTFELVYTSIREENTKQAHRSPVKTYTGEIAYFGDGNGNPKFIFDNYSTGKPKPTLLIKVFNDEAYIKRLKLIKTILDIGKNEFRYSPFAFAAPIGYGFFDSGKNEILGLGNQPRTPFMVYVFNKNSNDLQKVISVDNKSKIISGSADFNHDSRIAIAHKLFELFRILENLQLTYQKCEQYQIVHYDIKAANYIVDTMGNIFIVDLDSSGLYHWDKKKFIFSPLFDLTLYESSMLLPYEVSCTVEKAKSMLDRERWHVKERYSEIWLAWSLIYRVLTGFQSPFFFLQTKDHHQIYTFLKENNITDLFSVDTLSKGDFLDKYVNSKGSKSKSIKEVHAHLLKAVSPQLRSMINKVFIQGFYEFHLRPYFFRLSKDFHFLEQ